MCTLWIAAVFASVSALVGAEAVAETSDEQGPPMIKNPILPGFNPDPSIVRVGDDYYIATSTFEWFPGVRIHHSRDLVNWRLLTHALTRTSQLDMVGNPASGGVWAPCLSHSDGVFYLVYTNVRNCSGGFADAHNYLVTASDIEGPWSDPIYLNSSGFDPSMFHDEDGRKWLLNMVWNHRAPNKSGGIMLQEYEAEKQRLVGEPKLIFEGTEFGGTEAAHVYSHGGDYHLMTAEGGTGFGHTVTMARSKDLAGPYELDPANPVLTARDDESLALQKPGHASLVETQTGELFAAYLCGRPLPGTKLCNLGRETALQRCEWTDEGWLRFVGADRAPVIEVAAPDLPPHPFPAEPARDEFDNAELAPQFNTLREPPNENWLSLTERPGFLRLRGRESPASRFRQSLVARRLDAFRAEATTKVEFDPDSFQQLAGLVCWYNDKTDFDLAVTYDEDDGRVLSVFNADLGRPAITRVAELPEDGPVYMCASFDNSDLTLSYSLDGESWTAIEPVLDAGLLSDDHARGFTGTFVGVAAHDMTGRKQHVDFDFFEYRRLP